MNNKNKIVLATCFSGIGAIEQAILRLGIDHEIAFACDNGGRTINCDYDIELQNVRKLKNTESKKKYVDDLYKTNSKQKNFVKESYLANYKISEDHFFEDIKLLDGTDFENKIDLFVGGSPCQSFSIAGSRGGFEDTRGTLFYDYVRLIKEIKPKIFIYENVHGVLSHDNKRTWNTMCNVFDELGYHYKWDILNAKDYGIPQSRRRLFVVGFRDSDENIKFRFPETTELNFSMQDFLEDTTAQGSLLSVNGKLKIIDNKVGIVEERYYLSPKLLKYCLSPGTKNFMHHNAKIEMNRVDYQVAMRADALRCLLKMKVNPGGVKASAFSSAGETLDYPSTNIVEQNGWVNFVAKNFSYSTPNVEFVFSTPVVKTVSKTISCAKGKKIVKVKAAAPKCPKGYSKK